jgi:hypothetical protein
MLPKAARESTANGLSDGCVESAKGVHQAAC